ncbi:alpha/beta hydrolase [Plebeiibacterium marinum]|uniref:Alpha/beta hydrolase n=1 Tax=Plebeiibacterium marinum TaxID=2992111 RepID=A0AAE3MI50_9BACT|nr:alpha/beta hydrolase [Plebeiobacterium marinum]MCW3808071.1 alpha/beta hydrolase [Plebeiobacterium marinum]
MIKFINVVLVTMLGMITLNVEAQQYKLKLWPEGVPGSKENSSYVESFTDNRGRTNRVVRVTDPTISVFLPEKEKANGTAVLICPGGGYSCLAWDHEGFMVAKWLNDHGIAGVLLKYRLPSDQIMEEKNMGPLQDAQQAMRMIRNNAEKWNINPDKVGVMGFSAGGHLASTISTQYARDLQSTTDTTSARPDFSVLVYPVISMNKDYTHMGSRNNLIGKEPTEELVKQYSNELQINKETPMAFMVHSLDDRAVPIENSLNYYKALKANGVKGELHIFQKGGHGYGLDKSKGTQLQWPAMLLQWLDMNGF